MFKNIVPLLITFVLLILGVSCNKNKGDESPAIKLMSINFIDGFVPKDFEVLVFISDSTGQIIADTNCTENKLYDIFANENISIPQSFQVTIVRYDLFWHNLLIQMNTFTNIEPSDWTIKGNQPDTVGKVEVVLTNVPPEGKAKIFSTAGYYNYTVATKPQTCLLYQNPDKLYFKINLLPGGPFYKYLSDIHSGDEISLDLSEMQATDLSIITLPFPPAYSETRLWAFSGQDYLPFQSYLTDLVYLSGSQSSEVQVSFPPGQFDQFRTGILLQESFQTNKLYNYNLIGQIPSSVELPQMDILSINPGSETVELNTTGNYTTSRSLWEYMTSNNELFQWSVYAPEQDKIIQLPDVSERFMATFPAFVKSELLLSSAEIIGLQDANSYQQGLMLLFDENNPKTLEQLNYTSVLLNSSVK